MHLSYVNFPRSISYKILISTKMLRSSFSPLDNCSKKKKKEVEDQQKLTWSCPSLPPIDEKSCN